MTVYELTKQIKNKLSSEFSSVQVEGEISNYSTAASGHCYFTIKDDKAMINVVLFKGKMSYLRDTLEDGMTVNIHGSLSVFEKRGSYQIIADTVQKRGIGQLLQELNRRKEQFLAEGLFDDEHKKQIPHFPRRIAIVTSQYGAALTDIVNVLSRRNSGMHIRILPCTVQGVDAPASIARQICIADHYNIGEVIIVTRGGGSVEDLLCFSDEAVVRAIYNAKTPIISAVGHEIDWALSDFAADLRAPTPSAAAELVSARRSDLLETITSYRLNILAHMHYYIENARTTLHTFQDQHFIELFHTYATQKTLQIDTAYNNMSNAITILLTTQRARYTTAYKQLSASSPFEILSRGYGIVYRYGEPTRIHELQPHDDIRIYGNTHVAHATILENEPIAHKSPHIIPPTH